MMGESNRWCLFFAFFALVAVTISLALLPASSVNAASSWDNTVNTTDHLIISDLDGNYGPIDVTTSYTAIMADKCPSAYADYANTIADENGKWIIIQGLGSASYPDSHTVLVGWTTQNVSYEFTISGSYEVFKPTDNIDFIYIELNSSGNEVCNGPYNSQLTIVDPQYLWNSQPDQLIFLSTFPVTYPSGYEGIEIPDSWTPPPPVPVIRPDFTYQVSNKKITAHDYNQELPEFTPDEGYTVQGYLVEWTLYRCTSEWDDVSNDCTSELIDHQILLQDKDYNFTVEEYDDYIIVAQYLVEQCYRYPSYPATPDDCSYVDLGTELPDYDFDSTTVHLLVDGRSYTGDTTDFVCDTSGYCEPDELDCTDEPDFISRLTCQVNKQLNVGVINPSIVAFKNMLSSFVVSSSPQCDIPLSNVVIAPGKTYPLSDYSSTACDTAESFRDEFPIVVVLVNGLFGLMMIRLLVTIFNKLTDHKDTDIIQGV